MDRSGVGVVEGCEDSEWIRGGGSCEWARADRDIILVEQRGDHFAQPYLDCPETGIARSVVDGRLPVWQPGEFDGAPLRACYDRLTAEGVDLSAYTTSASAADLADLRRALGYPTSRAA